ncbi:MAG TPA: hypothetical protein VKZ66_09865 [Pusillimonas sp.]|nr:MULTISPECIES: hypothetical protein [unclassified Pusillimonas]HLU20253.1 hypothetical protein [Pusillimonas sp.]
MSKKPTQKKPPFVIEPLNWVAPDADRSKNEGSRESNQQSKSKRDEKD